MMSFNIIMHIYIYSKHRSSDCTCPVSTSVLFLYSATSCDTSGSASPDALPPPPLAAGEALSTTLLQFAPKEPGVSLCIVYLSLYGLRPQPLQ